MTKDNIEQVKADALSKICQAINLLEAEKRKFNDELKDNEGKSVEKEYNSIHNALASLKEAREELER